MTQKEFNNLKIGDKIRLISKNEDTFIAGKHSIGTIYIVKTILPKWHSHRIDKMIVINDNGSRCWINPKSFDKVNSFEYNIKVIQREIQKHV